MSTRRVKRQRPEDEGGPSAPAELDDDDMGAFTQLTQQYEAEVEEAMQKNALRNISEEERDELVSEIIRYVLFRSYAKNGRPIAQSELSDIVNKKYPGSKKGLAAPSIKLAQSKLLEVFGMELRTISRTAPSAKGPGRKQGGSAAGTTWYVVRSALPDSLRKRLVQIPLKKDVFNGFAMVVLGCIEAAGDTLMEEELWRLLGALGIQEKREHDSLGMIEDQLQRMCDMRYIVKEKITNPDGVVFSYKLAENALDEIGKENIQAYVKQVAGLRDDE
mmetsp:Transcript_30406/g.76648  ORF Transcript_30406/g.76648 Transcript_30406/m.76648 type:complete len:275 (+) Transcript_30406:3-827(+)|eukprot:jgi/Tetstr1/435860/TSEL_024748.t1